MCGTRLLRIFFTSMGTHKNKKRKHFLLLRVINFKIKIEMFYNIERPVSFVNWGEKCNELLGAVV